MEQREELYLVEVFYKRPHKRRRLFSFISKNSKPAPVDLWANIYYGFETYFGTNLEFDFKLLEFVITNLPEA